MAGHGIGLPVFKPRPWSPVFFTNAIHGLEGRLKLVPPHVGYFRGGHAQPRLRPKPLVELHLPFELQA